MIGRWSTILSVIAIATALPLASGCASKGHEGTGAAHESEVFGRLSVEELDAKMSEAKSGKLTLAIFDNNHKEVFDEGHIPTAKWVDYKAIKEADMPADKGATLVFYCANEH